MNAATKIVLDNGGSEIKAAKLSPNAHKPQGPLSFPNALARPAKNAIQPSAKSLGKSRRPPNYIVAREILTAPDMSGIAFRRPIDLGFVAYWDVQKDVWNSVFSSDMGIGLRAEEIKDGCLLVTEPVGVPVHMRRAMDELVFEHFSFAMCSPVAPQRLAAWGMKRRTCLVLDSGFSFTTAVPIVNGLEVQSCVRRLWVGGKKMTNYLKQTVSFRSWNMTDETAVMNAVKERLCYVSLSYNEDLERAQRTEQIVREYVLPDLSRGKVDPLGHILTEMEEVDGTEQVLKMNNERIAIPEILFNPSDIGLEQAGVAEIIFQSIEACDEDVRAELYSNVILTGGNCLLPNFQKRLEQELRPLVSSVYDVNVHMEDNPTMTTVKGGVEILQDEDAPVTYLSKSAYEESGSDGLLRTLYGDEMRDL